MTIKTLALPAGKVSDLSLLGHPGKLPWKQTAAGLIVTLPADAAGELRLRVETEVAGVEAVRRARKSKGVEK